MHGESDCDSESHAVNMVACPPTSGEAVPVPAMYVGGKSEMDDDVPVVPGELNETTDGSTKRTRGSTTDVTDRLDCLEVKTPDHPFTDGQASDVSGSGSSRLASRPAAVEAPDNSNRDIYFSRSVPSLDHVVRGETILPGVLDIARSFSVFEAGRLENFTDGVYSIVATLIMLEIDVPVPDIESVNSGLSGLHSHLSTDPVSITGSPTPKPGAVCPAVDAGEQPTFVCWWQGNRSDVLSGVLMVLLVGSLWMAHVALFALIRREHSGPVKLSLYRVNSAICAVVGFLPFAVSLIMDFEGEPYGPMLLGCVLCFVSCAMGGLMVIYACGQGEGGRVMAGPGQQGMGHQ